jgi:uncharacterized membrane protein
MASPASVKGHPIHAMLVPLPIGLWTFALVADLMAAIGGSPDWLPVAFYCIAGGIVGALLAAAPGLVDLLSLEPGPRRRTGIWHMVINLAAVAVFATNFLLRWRAADHAGPVTLTLVGVALICVSGWLGGQLVYVMGVSVAPAEGAVARRQR